MNVHVRPSVPEASTPKAYFSSRLVHDPSRDRLWRVLCGFLQREIPVHSAVLELGGGYCSFINNIRAAEKHVVDIYDGVLKVAGPGVIPHVGSCVDLQVFPDSSFDIVFSSNLFEHLRRDDLYLTLLEIFRVLRAGGKLIVIQPNYKYCFKSYFDDYTHVEVYTHVSFQDILVAHGFQLQRVVPRFLPFSLRNKAPKWSWLLRLYLLSPWRPFAGQMFIVAIKDSREPTC